MEDLEGVDPEHLFERHVASEDYPELEDILTQRPPLEHTAAYSPNGVDYQRYCEDKIRLLDTITGRGVVKVEVYGFGAEDYWGMFYPQGGSADSGDPKIAIYQPMAQSSHQLLSTLAHEYAHYIRWIDAGDLSHGGAWSTTFAEVWQSLSGAMNLEGRPARVKEGSLEHTAARGEVNCQCGHPRDAHVDGGQGACGRCNCQRFRKRDDSCATCGHPKHEHTTQGGYACNLCDTCQGFVKKKQAAKHWAVEKTAQTSPIPKDLFAGVQDKCLAEIVGGDVAPELQVEEGDYAGAQEFGVLRRIMDLSKLTTTQDWCDPAVLDGKPKAKGISGNDLPIVCHFEGTDYLVDGHHRAINYIRAGEPEQPVWFFDVDEHPDAVWTTERYEEERQSLKEGALSQGPAMGVSLVHDRLAGAPGAGGAHLEGGRGRVDGFEGLDPEVAGRGGRGRAGDQPRRLAAPRWRPPSEKQPKQKKPFTVRVSAVAQADYHELDKIGRATVLRVVESMWDNGLPPDVHRMGGAFPARYKRCKASNSFRIVVEVVTNTHFEIHMVGQHEGFYERWVRRYNSLPHREAVIGALHTEVLENARQFSAGVADYLQEQMIEWNDRAPSWRRADPEEGNWSYDWCIHRHFEHCYYPAAPNTPKDRGKCPYASWKAQEKSCPISEGPAHGKRGSVEDPIEPKTGALQWKRLSTGQGWESTDKQFILERGAPMSGGGTAWLIWMKARSEWLEEDSGSIWSNAPGAEGGPVRPYEEVIGENYSMRYTLDDDLYIHRNDAGSLYEAKETAEWILENVFNKQARCEIPSAQEFAEGMAAVDVHEFTEAALAILRRASSPFVVPDFDAIRKTSRWAGADGGYPVALPDGRTLWLFGDTLFTDAEGSTERPLSGDITDLSGGTWLFLRNSFLIQYGDDIRQVMWQPIPNEGSDWFWPTSAQVIANKLYVFAWRVSLGTNTDTAAGPFGFSLPGSQMIIYSLPDLMLEKSVHVGPSDAEHPYGVETLIHNGELYLYARGVNMAQYVAKVPPYMAPDDFDLWEFWDGSGWNVEPENAKAMVFEGEHPEGLIQVVEDDFTVYAVAKLNPFTADVGKWSSSGEGPWEYHGVIGSAQFGEGQFSYDPFLVGDTLFWSTNSFNNTMEHVNSMLYGVRTAPLESDPVTLEAPVVGTGSFAVTAATVEEAAQRFAEEVSMEMTDAAAAIMEKPKGWSSGSDPERDAESFALAHVLLQEIPKASRVSGMWSAHANAHGDLQEGDEFVIPLMTGAEEGLARDWLTSQYSSYPGALYEFGPTPAVPISNGQWVLSGKFRVTGIEDGTPKIVHLIYEGSAKTAAADDRYEQWLERHEGATYYHGTNQQLQPGDVLMGAEFVGVEFYDRAKFPHYDPKQVYLTDQIHLAERYAASRAGQMGGEPHIYEVKPTNLVYPDQEYLESGFGHDQAYTYSAEVVREVPLPGFMHWDAERGMLMKSSLNPEETYRGYLPLDVIVKTRKASWDDEYSSIIPREVEQGLVQPLIDDVRANGIKEPLELDYGQVEYDDPMRFFIVDGNHRAWVAEQVGVDPVPVVVHSRHGAPPELMGAQKVAAWSDVRSKAKRIKDEGGVRILSVLPDQITAQVKGDHGVYECSITRVPGTQQIALWSCECPWDDYSWGRSGPWKKYEGRACAHVTALIYEMQARGWQGGEVTEDIETPDWMVPGEDKVAVLQRVDWQGETGRADHPTCEETGTVPTWVIADLPGVMGERPGEHRTRSGESWQEFLDDIRANGIKSPIFITVDFSDVPRISEGNHRRDAAMELGLPEVPVEIRYFGNAQRQGTVLERAEGKTATKEGDTRAYGEYEMRYRQSDQGERRPRHHIETYLGDEKVGELNWYGTTGTVHNIDVEEEHSRKGIATAMWEWGQEMRPKPKHSKDRTDLGDAWAKSVGGPLPRRTRGVKMTAEADRMISMFAILHDEPEPALPVAYGEEEDEQKRQAIVLEDKSPEEREEIRQQKPVTKDPDNVEQPEANPPVYSVLQGGQPTVPGWDPPGGADLGGATRLAQISEQNADLAAVMQQRLALAHFSPEEQQELIREGEDDGLGARNQDRLNIEGTHYQAVEIAALDDSDIFA